MKNKPVKHKTSNTFKFKPFLERINDIDIDIFHRVPHRNEVLAEGEETYFYQSLQKWNVLNLSEQYVNFRKKMKNIITLPQLLNQKQHVIDTLMHYLKMKDSLILQTILELIVAVARDLQQEFYEYFPKFLEVIIDLLQSKDANQLEHTLTTLAYLFKFLWRYLIKNVHIVFNLVLPLLQQSQPTYINDFAAESFAFVVRKIKDKRVFLKLVLETLENHTNDISGCGKLLFQVVSGIQGHFHSSADQILMIYFDALHDESFSNILVFEVLKEVMNCIVNNIKPKKCEVLWTAFLDSVRKCMMSCNEGQKHLVFLIRLINYVMSHKGGQMLTDPMPLTKVLAQVIDTFRTGDVPAECTNLITTTLLATNVQLMQETSSYLILKILTVPENQLLIKSVEKLIDHASFETIVLPYITKSNIEFDSSILKLYTKIIMEKVQPSFYIKPVGKWKKYNLDINFESINTANFFVQKLKTLQEENALEDALRIVIILPHLRSVPKNVEQELLHGFVTMYDNLRTAVNCNSQQFHMRCLAFLLAFDSIVHIMDLDDFVNFITEFKIQLIELVKKYINNCCILKTFELFLTYISKSRIHLNYINEEMFKTIHEVLSIELSSPDPRVRLIVTHIYSLFADVKGVTLKRNIGFKSAFEIPYIAEIITNNVQSYREKLLHLQSLELQSQTMINLNPEYNDFTLRYLMGNLYANFSLLWDPIISIIATYANKQCEKFWHVFISELKSEKTVDEINVPVYQCDVISSIALQIFDCDEKIDYQNYKYLLWKCMLHFPDFCESKNRDLIELFINSVENNFFKSNSEDSKSVNIKKNSIALDNAIVEHETKDSKSRGVNDNNDSKSEMVEPDKVQNKHNIQVHLSAKRSNTYTNAMFKTKLLLIQLQVFGNISNPRIMHRESELYTIYLDLLSSKNIEVQKAALNCIYRYKHRYLMPYKDHLNSLINEKELKNELARFNINKESNIVQDNHREGLIPILMRIIYAKMVMRVGMRTGGKAGGLARRKMILRFLAGCQEEEMMIFAQMAFRPFHKYIKFTLHETVELKEIINYAAINVDLTNVIPPKQLQSIVNLLAVIIEQFGAKMMTHLLPKLLTLLLCILTKVTVILNMSEKVHCGFLPSIKNIRTKCIDIIARFFAHFENYKWSSDEIDVVFDAAVFPWLEKLPYEGIHSPTALLKMFGIWSRNPRYYPLLVKHQENEVNLTPLPYVVQLLMNKKLSHSVESFIMEMFENLMTLEDFDKIKNSEDDMQTENGATILNDLIRNKLNVQQFALSGRINYGSAILLPHVPNILEFMKNKLQKTNRKINKTELVILSRISELTTDAKNSDILLQLIIPILLKKSLRNESEVAITELITAIVNLIKNVEKPEKHIRSIIPLFSTVFSAQLRILLMNVLETIAQNAVEESRSQMIRDVELLRNLNAWNERWIEQPDFAKRLDTFTKINFLFENNEVSLELGLAVIHNCYFFLYTCTDLAIRDSAGQCLKIVGVKLANAYKDNNVERKYLIEDTILTLVRKGIRSKKEDVLLQSIAFLRHMAMECPDVHPVLRDLSLLTNKIDPEVDFFENMQHLQLHRRGRALRKFCTIAETLQKLPNPKTLTQFIFPLASLYLCNETFANKHSIIDDAIKTVATVCRLLPWHHYEIILKHYLDQLKSIEFQKQVVKIIVAILDAFHYDISKYRTVENVTKNMKQCNAMVTNLEVVVKEEIDISAEKVVVEEKKLDDEEIVMETKNEEVKEEILDEALENYESEEEEETRNEATLKYPVIQKQTVLSPYMAKRLVFDISKGLLPQLQRSIVSRTQHEGSHKVNRKQTGIIKEEEELLRIPVALAVIKLLQKLPESLLNTNLSGILMKMCTFLKSRLDSVRRAAREILQKIMIELGPEYLHYLLRELNSLLTKGFQVHVLAYTTHAVLDVLRPYFKPVHINQNVESILSVCKADLFGLAADEKEVAAIVRNTSEAKSTKSYEIFHILAEHVNESCMIDLLMPLKTILLKTHSHKTMDKITKCLNQIALGFSTNKFINSQQMLIFLYGVVSESIPQFLPEDNTDNVNEKETKSSLQQKSDYFIISPEPKNRVGDKVTAKTSKNTNIHALVEFGLRLCQILLKKNPSERNSIATIEFVPYLEPFVPILSKCLKSQHVKLNTLTLQCLKWILQLDLPSLRTEISDICSSIFNILHKYAVAGLSKGDNFSLVAAAFKTMSVIIRDVKYFTITEVQLKMLIIYIEQDLHDSDKNATTFRLLKAIIGRKFSVPEMHELMRKVANLSITSELTHVREQSRSAVYTYLLQYPIGTHIEKLIVFFANQLSYELQPGRLSALNMIHDIVTGFPEAVLSNHSGYLFLMLGARLVNDDDPTCRKNCAKCIKEMITRVQSNQRSKLFDLVVLWLKDKNVSHRRLAAQLCGIFVIVEKDGFESRLSTLLPLIVKQFHSSETENDGSISLKKFQVHNADTDIKEPARMHDHHIFQVLQLLLKISTYCEMFVKNNEYEEPVCFFAEQSQALLGHPHLWVRLAAAQLLEFILAALDIEKVERLLHNPTEKHGEKGYVYSNPFETLRSLSLDMIAQLQSHISLEKFTNQISKNLVYVAKLLKTMNPSFINTGHGNNDKKENKNSLSFIWLVKKMRKSINVEITQSPKSICVRSAVFNWMGGIIAKIPMEYLKPVLPYIMSPLAREMSLTDTTNTHLRHLAKEVAKLIKRNIGNEEYATLLSEAQQRLDTKRAERKRVRTQQFITDPELAAKRKISKQQKKREAKKRRMETIKGNPRPKKRTRKEIDLEEF